MRPSKQKVLQKLTETPRTAGQWFIRRIFLEGKEEEFRQLRNMLYRKETNNYGATFWIVAKQFFGYESKEAEIARCEELESELYLASQLRAKQLKEREEKRKHMQELAPQKDSTTYYEAVKWAFENWPLYLERTSGGGYQPRDEEKLRKECPSPGAYGLILYARDNPKEFQNLCTKVLGKIDVLEREAEASETKVDAGIDELKRALEEA